MASRLIAVVLVMTCVLAGTVDAQIEPVVKEFRYKTGVVSAQNRVAQQENLALWLVHDGKSPWIWVVPETVDVEIEGGVTFLKCDRTWVAIRPLGTSLVEAGPSLSRQLANAKKSCFPGHKVLSAKGHADSFCGLAIEMGENQSHGSFDQFVRSVLAAKLDTSELHKGIARYKASDGKHLGIHWNDDLLNLGGLAQRKTPRLSQCRALIRALS